MILSSIALWVLTSAILAAGVGVLFIWKRRQERAVSEFSRQLARLAREAGTPGRIGLEGKPLALGKLGVAVNELLENLEQRGARLLDREQLFQRLVETVHDAVLVHRKTILFANSRFLALLGMNAAEVVGKPLTDFVGPEYVELVDNNLRRRLSGEAAAERYEVELLGLHGEVTRVELSSTLIDSAGEPALLLTALEMLPSASPTSTSSRPRAMVTLDAMGESVITVDAEGRIDYINHAAEALLGQTFAQVVGKFFSDVASLVDETDRRSLGDPVRKALATGGRVTMGKRAVLVPTNAAPERSVEISVTPLKSETSRDSWFGAGAARHQRVARLDPSDDLSSQSRCADRPRQSPRIRAAAARGDGLRADRRRDACAVLPRSRSLQGGERYLRAHGGRQYVARGRDDSQRGGARFRYGRAHRRRRICVAIGGLPARQGAADRRRRGAFGQRLPIRLEATRSSMSV